MNTQKIAADYANSLKIQANAEDKLNAALGALGSDNQIFGLAETVTSAYSKLVQELLGTELFEWLNWWMYETEYGTVNMEFIVDNVSYDPTQLTFEQFWEIVCA